LSGRGWVGGGGALWVFGGVRGALALSFFLGGGFLFFFFFFFLVEGLSSKWLPGKTSEQS